MSTRLSEIAASGLAAATKRLEATAHNVANALTQGYRPVGAHSEALETGGVKVTISSAAREAQSAPGGSEAPARGDSVEASGEASQTDLIQETANRISASAMYTANLKALQTDTELNESLMNLVSHRA
jgi:flagellar basal body rod protein FlgC